MYGVPNNAILIGIMLSLLALVSSECNGSASGYGSWFFVWTVVPWIAIGINIQTLKKKICFLFFLLMPTYCFVTDESF